MSDAWGEMGRRDALDHPEAAGLPLCPLCATHGDVAINEGAAGGLLCWACMTVFTTAPGEWAAMTAARELYGREYRKAGT